MLNYFERLKTMPEISSICSQLVKLKQRINANDFQEPYKEYETCKNLFSIIKGQAISSRNERLANAQLIYKFYFHLFCHLSLYFGQLTRRLYPSSWDTLQDCMDDIKCVGRYVKIPDRKELPDILELLESYESLYPYKFFGSSEYIIKKSHCSICGKSMQSVACPHIKGNLYYGEIAAEIIDEIQEFQAVCVVAHPEDKRCIIEISDDSKSESERFAKLDQYCAMNQPFLQRFSVKTIMEWRERSDIIKVGRNEPCSCGSGLKFKKCCGKNLFYQHERSIVTPGKIVCLI